MNTAVMPTAWKESAGNVSIFDDFVSEALASLTYTTTATDSGTATVGDEVGGVITLAPSDGTVADNDEIYLTTINEVFLCGAGCDIEAAARIKFSEANTDDANVFFGFASAAAAANFLVDDGGGPRTSGNVIGIYKIDGGTVWRCVTRWGSTTSVTDSVSTATAGGTAWQRLGVSIKDGGSVGSQTVVFTLDGQALKDSTTGADIIHSFPTASATEMQLVLAAKNGGANNEAIKMDKWFASQSY